MLTAPRQNWLIYEAKCRDAQAAWLCGLTDESAWELLQSLFSLAMEQGAFPLPPEVARDRWEEKLAIRRRQVAAFACWDEHHHD